jgi:hypothetical protein
VRSTGVATGRSRPSREDPSGAARIIVSMTADVRSDLTARRLSLRLEELARALECAGAPNATAAQLLESASVATMHAVSLELVTSQRAEEIWGDAARRHPVLTDVAVRGRTTVPLPA